MYRSLVARVLATAAFSCLPLQRGRPPRDKFKDYLTNKQIFKKNCLHVLQKTSQVTSSCCGAIPVSSASSVRDTDSNPTVQSVRPPRIDNIMVHCLYKFLSPLRDLRKQDRHNSTWGKSFLSVCQTSGWHFLSPNHADRPKPQSAWRPKVDRTNKRKSQPGLADPYALYQRLKTHIRKLLT